MRIKFMDLFRHTKQIVFKEDDLVKVLRILNDMHITFGRIADVTDMFDDVPDEKMWTVRMHVNRDLWEKFVTEAHKQKLDISYAYAW